MRSFLFITQIVVSILLILVILSQEKGVAAGGTFGGSGMVFRGRRGVDRLLLWITIVLVALFIASSLAFIFVEKPSASPSASSSSPSVNIEGLPEGVTVTPVPVDESSSPPSQ